VDLAKKRRGGCSWKRPSYYLVERMVVFSECTLPVPPPPKCWFLLVFHEKEPLLFFRWVVLVRHFLLWKRILVQDSFAEKDP
jgi:hypothetical protein